MQLHFTTRLLPHSDEGTTICNNAAEDSDTTKVYYRSTTVYNYYNIVLAAMTGLKLLL